MGVKTICMSCHDLIKVISEDATSFLKHELNATNLIDLIAPAIQNKLPLEKK